MDIKAPISGEMFDGDRLCLAHTGVPYNAEAVIRDESSPLVSVKEHSGYYLGISPSSKANLPLSSSYTLALGDFMECGHFRTTKMFLCGVKAELVIPGAVGGTQPCICSSGVCLPH